jgi:hypothetical protein
MLRILVILTIYKLMHLENLDDNKILILLDTCYYIKEYLLY